MTTDIDIAPEHTARRQGADKDLHPEVIAAYRYVESVLDFADAASSKLGGPLWSGWALREAFLAGCSHATRTALDQSEPEGPTDEEILDLSEEHGVSCTTLGGGVFHPYQDGVDIKDDVLSFAHALIAADRARWGRPTIKPETNGQA